MSLLDSSTRPDLRALTEGVASQLGNSWQAGEFNGRPAIISRLGALAFEFVRYGDLLIALVIEQIAPPPPVEIPAAHIGPGICSRAIQERLLRPVYARLHELESNRLAAAWVADWQLWFLEQAAQVKLSVRFTNIYDRARIVGLRVVFADEVKALRWAAVTIYIDERPARLEVSDHAHELQALVTLWISGTQPTSPARHRAPKFRIFKR